MPELWRYSLRYLYDSGSHWFRQIGETLRRGHVRLRPSAFHRQTKRKRKSKMAGGPAGKGKK